MSFRRMDLTALLTEDTLATSSLLWVVSAQKKVTGVGLGKLADEPCVTLRSGKEAIAQFHDQKVKLDLTTMRFTAKDVEGIEHTLAFSTDRPEPLPDSAVSVTLP